MDFTVKLGFLAALYCLGFADLTIGQSGQPSVWLDSGEKHVRKFINDSYFVSCHTADTNTSRTEWLNPQNNTINTSLQNRIRMDETNFGADLFLTRLTSEDSGLYTCVTPTGQTSFKLTVVRPIVFDTTLEEQSATEGQDYKMKCLLQGHYEHPIRIYWKVDGRTPTPPKFKNTKDYGLIIRNVTQADARKHYMCRALDMDSLIPGTKVMNITLTIKMKPRLVTGARTEHYQVLGDRANLSCAVDAKPPARFEWVFKNQTLTPSDEVNILNTQENISILQVMLESDDNFGQYMCRARNELGTMERNLFLSKAQEPAIPVVEPNMITFDGARSGDHQFRLDTITDVFSYKFIEKVFKVLFKVA